jgi:hypothetical protein
MQTIKNFLQIVLLIILIGIIGAAIAPGLLSYIDNGQTPAPNAETPTAPDMVPLVVTSTPLPMPTPWTPVPTALPAPTAEPAATAPPVVTQAGELEVVTLALRNSERAAGDCLDAWVADAMAGRVPQSCAGILSQVNDLTVRHYELTHGGQ